MALSEEDYTLEKLNNQLVKNDPELKTVNLHSSKLTNSKILSLAVALPLNTHIVSLELGNNKLSDPSAISLANCLINNTVLLILGIGNNEITDLGVLSIANALSHNDTLQHLYLYFNKIKSDGMVALAKCLHINSTLEKLDLHGNKIGDKGVKEFSQCLYRNETLKYASFYGNEELSKDSQNMLYMAVENNSTITHLTYDLNFGSIQAKIYQKLQWNQVGEIVLDPRIIQTWTNTVQNTVLGLCWVFQLSGFSQNMTAYILQFLQIKDIVKEGLPFDSTTWNSLLSKLVESSK